MTTNQPAWQRDETLPAPAGDRPATRAERAAAVGLVLLAGLAGWLSYASVRALAVSKIGPIEGSAFPLLLDVAVFVSSQYYLSGASRGKAQHGYKTLTRALIATTITINAAAASDWRGILVHVVPPAVFASLVELRAKQVLSQAREAAGAQRIPLKLWIVSPVKAFRISLHVARLSAHGDLWAARERRAAAERALKLAVPGRSGRQARRQARAVLRTGQLDPAALIAATGLDQHADETGAAAVLRVALRASLGVSGTPSGALASQGVSASPSASGTAPSASRSASGSHRRGAPVAGDAASGPIVLPQPRRARPVAQGASDTETQHAAALAADRAALAETGRPISMRGLMRDLRVGQATATDLRDWLAAHREQLDTVTHANGNTGP